MSLISEHLDFLNQSDDYSKSTFSSATAWLSQFRKFCGDRCPTALKVKDLEQWHKELVWTPGPSGKHYSEGTVNQAVGAVRRFYRRLLAEGKLKKDPSRTLSTPKAKKVRSQRLEFTPSEKRRAFASLNLETPYGIRDRAVLGVLLETGITRPTCSRIDREHLCFDTGALITKGRVQKIHSLDDGLLADLHRYLREARPLLVNDISRALFLDSYGKRLSGGAIQQIVIRVRTLAES